MSVQRVSVQGGLCQGDSPPERDSLYGNERTVRMLLECILVVQNDFAFSKIEEIRRYIFKIPLFNGQNCKLMVGF